MRPVNGYREVPDRVYVRVELGHHLRLTVWGMEHGRLRSEVVEPRVPGRRPAGGREAVMSGIERDLRRGVGLGEQVLAR
jgi:hypothetical protein